MYLVEGEQRNFLTKARTLEELLIPKSTILRIINQMSIPKPGKGAELYIEHSSGQLVRRSLYGASRLRWIEVSPTGRLVQSEPAIQGLGPRTEVGKRMRSAFLDRVNGS
jgi:hypothetical protein